MIDQNDTQTQTLDLGETKRRRGRPATGNAQSNADRQKAYRERQKAQRNEKGGYTREQVQQAVQEYQDIIGKLQKEIESLKAQLQEESEKWVVQRKSIRTGRWKTLTPRGYWWDSKAEAEQSIPNLADIAMDPLAQFRVIRIS